MVNHIGKAFSILALVLLVIGVALSDRSGSADLKYSPTGEPTRVDEEALEKPVPIEEPEAKLARVDLSPLAVVVPMPIVEPHQIRGRVLDTDQNPVGPATVWLKSVRGRLKLKKQAGIDGTFSFKGVPEGDYMLIVEDDSLPPGYTAPHSQERILRDVYPLGFFATVVSSSTEGQEENLYVHRTGGNFVHGFIHGPEGEPISGVMVSLDSQGRGLQSVNFREFSDGTGYWKIEGIIPGKYAARVSMHPGHPWALASKPLPLRFEMEPDRDLFIPIEFGGGTCNVQGRLLDQDGQPFSGVRVLAYYYKRPALLEPGEAQYKFNDAACRVYTDEEGRFTLKNLPSALIKIAFAPYDPWDHRAAWSKHFSSPPEHITLDLEANPPTTLLGTITVERPKAFKLIGSIKLGDDWRQRFRVVANIPQEEPEIIKIEGVRVPYVEGVNHMEQSTEGIFEWGCLAPFPDAVEIMVLDLLSADQPKVLFHQFYNPKYETIRVSVSTD